MVPAGGGGKGKRRKANRIHWPKPPAVRERRRYRTGRAALQSVRWRSESCEGHNCAPACAARVWHTGSNAAESLPASSWTKWFADWTGISNAREMVWNGCAARAPLTGSSAAAIGRQRSRISPERSRRWFAVSPERRWHASPVCSAATARARAAGPGVLLYELDDHAGDVLAGGLFDAFQPRR